MPRYFDLSHPIQNQMPVYPGDRGPKLATARGVPAPWRVTSLSFGSHTGTHMDAPAHYFPGGRTIDSYPPERLILPGVVWDVPGLPDEGRISWAATALQTAFSDSLS